MKENQKSILDWSQQTFGVKSVSAVATRMNKEVAELLAAVDTANECIISEGCIPDELLSHLQSECADVYIVLSQVAQLLGCDLQYGANAKMAINRQREWVRTPDGTFQHKD